MKEERRPTARQADEAARVILLNLSRDEIRKRSRAEKLSIVRELMQNPELVRGGTVDLSANPFFPVRETRVLHHLCGPLVSVERRGINLYVGGQRVELYVTEWQKQMPRGMGPNGFELLKLLKDHGRVPYNANLLRHLLRNPALIPDEWETCEEGEDPRGFEYWKFCKAEGRVPAYADPDFFEYALQHPHLIPGAENGGEQPRAIPFWGTIYRDLLGTTCVLCLLRREGKWGVCSRSLCGTFDYDDYALVSSSRITPPEILRRVRVDRTRSPFEIFDTPSRRQHVEGDVIESMPGHGKTVDEVEVYFFEVGRPVSDPELEQEYELRGLVPADPYALAAVNEADPAFACRWANATHWKDAEGWCFSTYFEWFDATRDVEVGRKINEWHDIWWFAGVAKSLRASPAVRIPNVRMTEPQKPRRRPVGRPSVPSQPGDSIVRVDPSIRLNYPEWAMHPDRELPGPAAFDASSLELWLHENQRPGMLLKGQVIYEHLKSEKMLESCLGLRDLEAMQAKGIGFFRRCFAGMAVFAWKSVVQHHGSDALLVPYLSENGDVVVVDWYWLARDWRGHYPALRFAK